MTRTAMAVAAGALYSAAYVGPAQWAPACLVLSGTLVLLLRRTP